VQRTLAALLWLPRKQQRAWRARRGAARLGAGQGELVQGGWARAATLGTGGHVNLVTGVGAATSSGHVLKSRPDAGIAGTSGSIAVGTGAATCDLTFRARYA
jgi:hypothetical protein